MDYQTGPGPGAHELRGALSQSLCVKSLLCISYLWFNEVYFVNLMLTLIECSCAELKNVHVRQGRNYRQCSQREGFVGKAGPVLLLYMSRPRGPWFHNPSMCVGCVCVCVFLFFCVCVVCVCLPDGTLLELLSPSFSHV